MPQKYAKNAALRTEKSVVSYAFLPVLPSPYKYNRGEEVQEVQRVRGSAEWNARLAEQGKGVENGVGLAKRGK